MFDKVRNTSEGKIEMENIILKNVSHLPNSFETLQSGKGLRTNNFCNEAGQKAYLQFL